MDLFNKNPKALSKRELNKKHRDVIEYLNERYAYFVTYVLQLGKPEWTNRIPTAAVDCSHTIDKDGNFDPDNFKFVFNPEFATLLPLSEMAFVEAHETMHVLLNHLRLLSSFVDRDTYKEVMKSQKDGTRPSKEEIKKHLRVKRDMQVFNIAADCVINDYLISCGLEEVTSIPLMKGEDWIGESAAYMTVTEVFDRIKLNQEKQQGEGESDEDSDGEGSDQSGSGSGSGEGEPGGKFTMADGSEGEYSPLDDHNWMLGDDDIDKMAEALDKLYEEMENAGKASEAIGDMKLEEDGQQTQAQKDLANSMKAGTEAGNMSKFVEQSGIKLGWAKLLKEIDPNIFKEPGIAPPQISSFHARRRKLNSAPFKRINLPVYRTEERQERETNEVKAIVLALDVSGSIGPHDANRFMTLAKSIPPGRIKIFCCLFDTSYRPFDPQNDTDVRVGGGTHFDAIPQFIEDKVRPELKGAYPKSVVIITDGQAPLYQTPSEDEAKGWFWLISPHDRAYGYPASRTYGKRAMLEEYVD